MKICDYARKEFCIMDIKSTAKEDAIREIVAKMSSSSGRIKNKELLISEILKRESLGSTGIGKNVAIPHARTDAVDGFVIGFGRSKNGIDFSAIDSEKVNFIFLMGANPQELNLYLRLLAELSKLLMEDSFRKELLYANTSEDVIDIFKNFSKG